MGRLFCVGMKWRDSKVLLFFIFFPFLPQSDPVFLTSFFLSFSFSFLSTCVGTDLVSPDHLRRIAQQEYTKIMQVLHTRTNHH